MVAVGVVVAVAVGVVVAVEVAVGVVVVVVVGVGVVVISMRILIIDTETTDIDPAKGHLIEVAWAVWCTTYKTMLHACSYIVTAKDNPAEPINGIPAGLLVDGVPRETALLRLYNFIEEQAYEADEIKALVAHNAEFDQQWLGRDDSLVRPWICSMDDIEWPKGQPGWSLLKLAVAHGVGVVTAHRALNDVLTLVRLFERVAEQHDIDALIQRALRPRTKVQALVSYDDRNKAKEAGFSWRPEEKMWVRRMAIEDLPLLPFKTKPLNGNVVAGVRSPTRVP